MRKALLATLLILSVFALGTRQRYDYLDTALIAHYKMNDNLATDVILDDTGSHNGAVKDAGGTATSAFHSVAGKINNAQYFDRVDDYIEIADHADFSPILTPFSISVWLNAVDFTNFRIATKGVYNTDAEWQFAFTAGDILYARLYDENVNSCFIGRKYNLDLSAYQGTWIHLVVTYSGGAGGNVWIRLYLNGGRVDDTNDGGNATSFVSVQASGHAVWIGRYSNAYTTKGSIDNMMFFNIELSSLQIKRLYNAGRGVESLGLRTLRSRYNY